MKHLLLLGCLIWVTACNTSNQSVESGQALEKEKMQTLAKKYGANLTFYDAGTGKDTQGKALPAITLEEMEKKMQSVANLQKQYDEESKQAGLLQQELNQQKPQNASDFFDIVEKYPLIKQQYVEQYGGETGFMKFKNGILNKEKATLKKQQLKN